MILTGLSEERHLCSDVVRPCWNVRHDLRVDGDIVLYGCRIIVPRALRREVISSLHSSHQGIVRTTQRARQSVYWPNLANDIKVIIAACSQCKR